MDAKPRSRKAIHQEHRLSEWTSFALQSHWVNLPLAHHKTFQNSWLYAFASLRLSLLFFLFAACVPATPPPVLLNTPGPGVTITDDHIITEAFALLYPSGWRVITSEAAAPPRITLVAPGDCEIIVVSANPIDLPTSPSCGVTDVQNVVKIVMLGSTEITAAGVARDSEYEAFREAFERVVDSITEGRG